MTKNRMICLTLPLPPTVNHYYCRQGNRTFIGSKGLKFRKQVAEIVAEAGHKPLQGRLSLFAAIFPANRIKQDLDNRSKALQDALTHAGVWLDDEQIDQLTLVRREVVKGGMVKVVITEIE